MADKYKFDPNTLSYAKKKKSFGQKVGSFFTYAFVFIGLGVIVNILYSTVIDSPNEKRIKRENTELISHYNKLNEEYNKAENVRVDLTQRDDNIYRLIFNAEPSHKTAASGVDGLVRYKMYETMTDEAIVSDMSKQLDSLIQVTDRRKSDHNNVVNFANSKSENLKNIPAIQPIENKDLSRIVSGYGWRIDPIYKTDKLHEGMDFAAPIGTEVLATADGVVEYAKMNYDGYGNNVDINHGSGYLSRYAHLSKILVRKGAKVKRGDVIGLVGNTGKSVGPHLHYEVLLNDKTQNPAHFYFYDITPKQYNYLLSMRGGQPLD